MTTSERTTVAAGTPLDCEQAVRRLWDHVDAELSPLDQAAVDAHLANCGECTGHFVFERRFLAAIHAAQRVRDDASAPFVSEVRTRVLNTLRSAGAFGATENGR